MPYDSHGWYAKGSKRDTDNRGDRTGRVAIFLTVGFAISFLLMVLWVLEMSGIIS